MKALRVLSCTTLLALTHCGTPLFGNQDARARIYWSESEEPRDPDKPVRLTVFLQYHAPEESPVDCRELSPTLRASFNGQPMEVGSRGGQALFEPCSTPSFSLDLPRPAPGTREPGRVVISDHWGSFVLEVDNLVASRGFQPVGELPEVISAHQALVFEWTPVTDPLSSVWGAVYTEPPRGESTTLAPLEDLVLEAHRLSAKMTGELSAGPIRVDVAGSATLPVTRCAGPRSCEAFVSVRQAFRMRLTP